MYIYCLSSFLISRNVSIVFFQHFLWLDAQANRQSPRGKRQGSQSSRLESTRLEALIESTIIQLWWQQRQGGNRHKAVNYLHSAKDSLSVPAPTSAPLTSRWFFRPAIYWCPANSTLVPSETTATAAEQLKVLGQWGTYRRWLVFDIFV